VTKRGKLWEISGRGGGRKREGEGSSGKLVVWGREREGGRGRGMVITRRVRRLREGTSGK
jgi:hypothetical protein